MGRESELIWHYTTTAGLKGILVDHKLWATSVSFVNDPSEQRFGQEAIIEALRRLTKHPTDAKIRKTATNLEDYLKNGLRDLGDMFGFAERMVTCASLAADSLDLWRGYGAQDISGTFAVGLDPGVPLGPLFSDPETLERWTNHWGEGAVMPAMRDGWTSLNYVSAEQLADHAYDTLSEELAKLEPREDFEDEMIETWRVMDRVIAEVEARYKHNAYSAEREVRLQATLTSKAQFQIVPRPHGISAYMELTASEQWGRPVSVASCLPVREVVLWPNAPRQAFAGVSAALVYGGHNYSPDPSFSDPDEPLVAVSRSNVPFV